MPQMKTPGVYIVEKNAFPNSVVEVATAIPAFIGHTEKADNGGKSLTNKPWRITSMAEFHNYYGGSPDTTFEIEEITKKTPPVDAATSAKSAGKAASTKPAGKAAVAKPAGKAAAATSAGKAVAATSAGKAVAATSAGEADFTLNGNKYQLKVSSERYLLYYGMLLFFQNGGGPCYIVSIGDYNTELDPDKMKNGIKLLIKEQEPTMVVIPEAVMLKDIASCTNVQQASLQHCGNKMKNRVSILDIYDGYKDRQDPSGDCINEFRDALGINYLNYAAAYYPWVNTSIVQDGDLSYFNISSLDTILTNELVTPLETEIGNIVGDDPDKDEKEKKLQGIIDQHKSAISEIPKYTKNTPEADMLNKTLLRVSSVYQKIVTEMKTQLNLLPPSAAIAGIYTMVDNLRGVWKAPANVSLNAVVTPAVNITHDDQEDLNITIMGKSINAIRSFIGEGTLVWGARTLDGNSQDWRYVNVRRTLIMLEESIKLATKAYVFENNTANTWVTIKSMINNFLNGIWKRGGLAGASPADAFSVHVGLGETMTPNDILDGILRVTVLVAISHPAEFIEITFQQQMQKS